jgi:hypothetical protein
LTLVLMESSLGAQRKEPGAGACWDCARDGRASLTASAQGDLGSPFLRVCGLLRFRHSDRCLR